MKFFVAVIGALGLFLGASAGEGSGLTSRECAPKFIVAVAGEVPRGFIEIPSKAGPSVKYAAEELQKYIFNITGVKLEITAEGVSSPKSVLIRLKSTDEYGPDGFRLHVEDGKVLTIAGGCRGVLYGAYEVLETYGGCAWYASWHEVVPKCKEFAVPGNLDDAQKPAFEMHSTVWKDVKDNVDFGVKLRFNGHPCDGLYNLEEKHGGMPLRFVNGLRFCHTFHHILNPKVYFKDHPEWFSEVKGVRRDGRTQICLTNPEAFEQAYSNVCARIDRDLAARKKAGDAFSEGALAAGISQDDWHNYCECPNCKAIDDREASHAGSLLYFINRMAERLAKRYPGMLTQTLIYQYTRTATKSLFPNEHVIPMLCSIECSFAHPLADRDDRHNARFMDDLAAWSKRTKNLYVWDYSMGCNHFFYPMPNVHALGPNMRTFRDYGTRYFFEEGGPKYAYFAELKVWLISKLMWNPDRELEPLLDKFFKGHYGAAAPYVRAYFDRCEAAVKPKDKAHFTIWEYDRKDLYPDSFVAWGKDIFAKALAAVKDDPLLSRNVRIQAFGPICMHLDRRGKETKSIWVSRHPERFKDCADVQEDLKWAFQFAEELKPIGGLYLGNTPQKSEKSWTMWKKMRDFTRPTNGCDYVKLGVRDLHFTYSDYGEFVKDKEAFKGECVRAFNSEDWYAAVTLDFGGVAFDNEADYVVRFRAKVDKAPNGKGEAFNAELGGRRVARQVTEVKEGWQWYEFPPMHFKDNFVFHYKNGRFAQGGGRGAVRCTYIDSVEIRRK